MDQKLEIVLAAKDATAQAFGFVQGRLNVLKSHVFSLQGAIGGLVGAYGLKELASSFMDAGIYSERMGKMLTAATGSVEASDRAQKLLTDTSERLGLVFKDQVKGYGQLAAAAKGTSLEGAQTIEIYLGLVEASTALQLSQDETKGALIAVQQMISKGKVSAEELRQQLGERLPGAFQIAADSIGVTTKELDKMLKEGKIISEDFLPKFAVALRERFGKAAAEGANTAQASINRLKNTWYELQTTVMNSGMLEEVKNQVGGINTELKGWLEANDALLQQKIPEYITATKDALSQTLAVYNAIPEEVKSGAGWGLVGAMLLGKKGGLIVGTVVALNEALAKFNLNLGSILSTSKSLMDTEVQNILDVITGKRDWNTGAIKREGPFASGSIVKARQYYDAIKATAKAYEDLQKEVDSGIAESLKSLNNTTKESIELSAEQKKELTKDLKDIENSLKAMGQEAETSWLSFSLGAEQAEEAAEKAAKELKEYKDILTEGMQGELDALMQLQAEVDAGIKESVESFTKQNEDDLEHFLDRMQDLFGDTFNRIAEDGLQSFDDLLGDITGLVSGYGGEQLAQAFRKNIFEPIAKGGSANWSGMAGALMPTSPLQGAGIGAFGYQTIGGMMGLPQGGYSGIGSAIGAGIGTMIMPGVGTAAGALLGGLGGSLFGGNGKNLQWGVGSGSGLDSNSTVNTAFGRVGAWDKHEDIDGEAMRPYFEKVAEVTYKIAEGISQDTIDAITADMASWSSGQSAKVTAENISGKSMQYLKEISGQLEGWLADLIDNWTGSFDELYTYLVGRESTLGQMQATVDAIIRPMGDVERINVYWDQMIEAAKNLHAEESLVLDIEASRTQQLQDYADAQQAAADADAARAKSQALDTVLWQARNSGNFAGGVASYISQKYGIPGSQLTPDWAKSMLDWSQTPGLSLTTDQKRDIDLIRDAYESLQIPVEDAARALGGFSNELDQAKATIQGAIGSIDDLVLRLTGGDLAPVQSAEFFTGQYAKLLGMAGQSPENVGALTSFVPGMMDFFSGIGGDYNELTQRVIQDLMGLKTNLAQQELTINVNVLLDGQVIGNTVARQTLTNGEVIKALNDRIDIRVGRA